MNIRYNLNAGYDDYKGVRLDHVTNILHNHLDPKDKGLSLQKYVSGMGFKNDYNGQQIFYRGTLVDGASQTGVDQLNKDFPKETTSGQIPLGLNGRRVVYKSDIAVQNPMPKYHDFIIAFEKTGLLFLGIEDINLIGGIENGAESFQLPFKLDAKNYFIPTNQIEDIHVYANGYFETQMNIATDDGDTGVSLKTNLGKDVTKRERLHQVLKYYTNNKNIPLNGAVAGNLLDPDDDPSWAGLNTHVANYLKDLGYKSNLDTISRIAFKGLQKSSGNNSLLNNLKTKIHRGYRLNDLLSIQDNGLLILGTKRMNTFDFFTGHNLFIPFSSITHAYVDHEHEQLKHRRVVLQTPTCLIMFREGGTDTDSYSLRDENNDDAISNDTLNNLINGREKLTKFIEDKCTPTSFLKILEYYEKASKSYDTPDDLNLDK